jgi:MoxR-like ATPase
MAKQLRPSPSQSATEVLVGTKLRGNDGRIWEARATSAGVQRWVPVGMGGATVYTSQIPTNAMHKFKVGDKVKVVKGGYGVSPDDINTETTIVEKGYYGSNPGYRVDFPALGNSRMIAASSSSSMFDGMIGEVSFELVTQPIQQSTITKPINMAKTKSITKRTAQETRTIETSLINKEEVFKMLALAESTGLPLLLVGQPGVGKTKTIIEYAKAWLNKDGKMTAADFANKIYILETDEGTKASEIKGMPDLSVLFTENKYQLSTPITEAEIVVINEVDKASSAIRNAMLGVMNEKFLFNGKHKIPCKWKIFVATCNEIPKEEADSPFWDRFMLKQTVNRVSAGELVKYFNKGARDYRETFKIGVPSKAEVNSLEIPTNKLEKYLEVGYTASSDRTLTFVPTLTKAVSYIWDISIDKALVKTAQIMISQSAGSELQNKLMSPEVKAVMSKVEMLHSYSNNEQLELAIAEIESLINTYTSRNIMDEGQVEEIELSMQYILSNHPARVDYTIGGEFDQMMESSDLSSMAPTNPF